MEEVKDSLPQLPEEAEAGSSLDTTGGISKNQLARDAKKMKKKVA